MKRQLLVAGVSIGVVIGALALGRREEPMSSALLQAQAEHDNKICRARLDLAHLAVDYLSSIKELEDTRKIQQERRYSEKEAMLCSMLVTLERTNPDCLTPAPSKLIHLRTQVDVAATALRNGRTRYQEQAKEIQRTFLAALGITNPDQQKSGQLLKRPSCPGDEYIETAMKQLHSS